MSEVSDELNALEQRLVRAWVEHDRAAVVELLSDDWKVIDPGGRVLTKAQVLEEFDTGARKLESGTIDEVEVRAYGDFAVVTGRTTAQGSYEGNTVSVRLRFTDVFVRRGGAWQVVSSQATLIST
jgi:ketosteroid isomerase-like protein